MQKIFIFGLIFFLTSPLSYAMEIKDTIATELAVRNYPFTITIDGITIPIPQKEEPSKLKIVCKSCFLKLDYGTLPTNDLFSGLTPPLTPAEKHEFLNTFLDTKDQTPSIEKLRN